MTAQRVAGRFERVVSLPEALNDFTSKGAILKNLIANIQSTLPDTHFISFDELKKIKNGTAGWFFDSIGVSAIINQPMMNEGVSDHSVRLATLISEKAATLKLSKHLWNTLVHKYQALTQIPGEKFHLRESEVAPLMPILVEENQWLKEMFGEGFYDEEINFSYKSVTLNDEQREFIIDNLLKLPEPIIQSAVNQYLAEH